MLRDNIVKDYVPDKKEMDRISYFEIDRMPMGLRTTGTCSTHE